jgi:predicted PurR-regulated permease PerM
MKATKLANYAVIFIALVLLAIVLKTFQSVLRPLAIATLLVFIFTPLAHFSKQKKIPVWITFAGLFIVVFLVIYLGGSFIITDNMNFQNALPQYQERISQGSGGVLALASKLGFDLKDITPEDLSEFAAKGAATVLSAVRSIFSETLLAMILMMFLIQSRSGLFSLIERKFGREEVGHLQATFQKIEGDIATYFGTKAAMSLGTAIGTGIVLLLFQADFIYISLLMVFMLNFIPIVGSLFAVVIILLMYMLTSGISVNAVWLLLALMAVQVFFGNILEPKVTGKRLKMSPILIIISLYVWGWIWGVVGMLLSVPLTILVMIITRHMGAMRTAEPALSRSG